MPLSKKGKKIKKSMSKTYGKKKGENVFYATMNKKGMKPDWENMRAKATKMMGGKK